MADDELRMRCLRCGTGMELRDPVRGGAWAPVQYWVCPRCARHFWTTYPPPKDKEKAAADAAPAATASVS